MERRRKYLRKEKTLITAVRLELDTEGFTYERWGGTQRCKRGDWLVSNGDDTYTIDAETFAATYRQVARGLYEKSAPVWAERARHAGSISTKEGSTEHAAGDYLVFNDAEGRDGYAMAADTFHSLYTPAD